MDYLSNNDISNEMKKLKDHETRVYETDKQNGLIHLKGLSEKENVKYWALKELEEASELMIKKVIIETVTKTILIKAHTEETET